MTAHGQAAYDHGKCDETLAQLQTFLDRELTDIEVTTVRMHLDRCPPCKQVFRFEEHVRRLVKVRCMADVCPSALRDKILARVKSQLAARTPTTKARIAEAP